MRAASTVMVKLWFKLRLFGLDIWLRPERPWDMVRLGSYYGGWWIPISTPADGTAVCVGAGLDVSFDLELQRLGYEVVTVDPTPAAVEFVTRRAPDLRLLPVGVWDQDGWLSFRQDARFPESWFPELTPTGEASACEKSFPVHTIKSLLALIDNPEVAILKLDVEGAEHRVVQSLLADDVRPRTLCVEFDDNRTRSVLRTTRLIKRHGYTLHQIENLNFTFVRTDVRADLSSPDQVARQLIVEQAGRPPAG